MSYLLAFIILLLIITATYYVNENPKVVVRLALVSITLTISIGFLLHKKHHNELIKIAHESINMEDFRVIEIDDSTEIVVLLQKGDNCSRHWIDPASKVVTEKVTYSKSYCEKKLKKHASFTQKLHAFFYFLLYIALLIFVNDVAT